MSFETNGKEVILNTKTAMTDLVRTFVKEFSWTAYPKHCCELGELYLSLS